MVELDDEVAQMAKEMIASIEKESEELLDSLKNEVNVLSDSGTERAIERIFRTNQARANEINREVAAIRQMLNNIQAQAYKNLVFTELVKSNGPWDLKRTLGTNTYYTFRWGRYTGEHIGNAHYEYMGKKLNYTNYTLKFAAGFVQILSGTSDIRFWNSYFDDPRDQEAIQHGIDIY
ncbi:polymorphic toxin type 44 domain-containing protein [Halalkalibacter oceani]|uniref:polymorphic toxin type 44 domain-containing protein n=1 Tax=Halalkalibacter oceani TaxID=1653776 RepID=UPI00339B48D4